MTLIKKTIWKPGIRLQNLVKLEVICSVIVLITLSLEVQSNPKPKKVPRTTANKPGGLKITDVADTTIRGRITDSSGAPLAGVSVLIKGTKRGTFTNASGDFELTGVSSRATLVISNVGYQSREVRLSAGQTNVTINLYSETGTLPDVVITGFQKIDKKKFTGAAVALKAADIKLDGVADASRMLEG